VWLGLLPLFLDLVWAYIPAAYIPSPVRNLLDLGASWQLTVVLMTIGLLVAAYLVQLETDVVSLSGAPIPSRASWNTSP
jgi:hypothetical protein